MDIKVEIRNILIDSVHWSLYQQADVYIVREWLRHLCPIHTQWVNSSLCPDETIMSWNVWTIRTRTWHTLQELLLSCHSLTPDEQIVTSRIQKNGGNDQLSQLNMSQHNSFFEEENGLVVTQSLCPHNWWVCHCICVFFQVVIIFLQKMDILLAKTPKDDVRDHVLPMVCKALEASDVQLQVQL